MNIFINPNITISLLSMPFYVKPKMPRYLGETKPSDMLKRLIPKIFWGIKLKEMVNNHKIITNYNFIFLFAIKI